MLFDTHCHVNLYPDAEAVMREIQAAALEVTCVTTEPAMFEPCRDLVADVASIHPALGLLPHEIRRLAPELDTFKALLPLTRYVGEIGLDYVTEDEAERALQRKVFDHILDACASAGDKLISIHSRRAAADVVDRVKGAFPGTIILHWFSGQVSTVEAAEGCYFSVNTAMIKSRSGKKLIRAMDPDYILTETDGPFVELEDRPVRPLDLKRVVNFFSQEWACSYAEAEVRIETNARRAGFGGGLEATISIS